MLAVVTGEAGIGKSALVSTFVGEPRRTGAMVVTVGCFEAERSLYLQPLLEAVRVVEQRIDAAELRELAGRRLDTLAALLPELAELAGPVDRGRGRRWAARSWSTGAAWTRWWSSSTGSATGSRCCW